MTTLPRPKSEYGAAVIVCRTVHDSPRPPRSDSIRARCLCDAAIWVSKRTVDEISGALLLCNPCAVVLTAMLPPGLADVVATDALRAEGKDAATFLRQVDSLKRA